MESTEKERRFYQNYLRLVAAAGLGISLMSLFDLPFGKLDWQFAILIAFALALGSRIAIKIEYTRTSISVIDVFSFLIFLLYGCSAAVLLGAAEAFISSGRHSKQLTFRLFNAGAIAISFYAAFETAELFFGAQVVQPSVTVSARNLVVMAVVVLVHYLVNTGLIAFASSFRYQQNFFSVWKEHYFWIFVPFLASGSAALISAGMINHLGFVAFLIMLPIVGIIYSSYQSHQEKLDAVVSQAKLAETHLLEMRESEERFRSAFSNAPIGIALISNDGKWVQVNEALGEILACTEEELLAEPLKDAIYESDILEFLSQVGAVIKGTKSSFQSEIRFVNRQKEIIWTQTSVSLLNDSPNSRLICQVQDISARRIAEESLRYNAFYDSLTDLANRNFFMTRLDESLDRAKFGQHFAVIFVDLDRFKLINDTVGHTVGDKVLISVASRLGKCVPKNATLARFGSDEFLILVQKESTRSEIDRLVDEIESQMGLVFSVGAQEITLTASIGVVFYDVAHNTAEDVLRDADTALHIAKKQGRHCHIVFDDSMRAAAIHQNRLERDLYRALERRELFLVYQPIVTMTDQRLTGFEALLRWEHPELGLVSPLEFIPLAEENGMIVEIGNFVLEQACRQIREWRNHFGREMPLFIGINVSSKQLLQKDLLGRVIQTLERYRIEPHHLKLEITESVVVENSEYMISILKQFRAMGVKLSMDDFGTGYSSLSYLHKLPVDTLKIDRSFVSKVIQKKDSAEIVKTILLLAKNLKLETVAEGIEHSDQLEFLRGHGCDFAQGFYISKPLSVTDALVFISRTIELHGADLSDTIEAESFHFQH